MRTSTNIRYEFRSALRSKARSLGLLLTVLLPVAMITGVSTSVDNTEFARIASALDVAEPDMVLTPKEIPTDIGAFARLLGQSASEMEQDPLVKSAIPAVQVMLFGSVTPFFPLADNQSGTTWETTICLLCLPRNLSTQDAHLIGVDNFTLVTQGACLLDRGTANDHRLDNTTGIRLDRSIGFTANKSSASLILNIRGIVDLDNQLRTGREARFRASFPAYYVESAVIVGLDSLEEVATTLEVSVVPAGQSGNAPIARPVPGAQILLFLDRDQLFQSGRAQQVKDLIAELEASILSSQTMKLSINNKAWTIIQGCEEASKSTRNQFVALSLPLLGVSVYLGYACGENIISRRRREIALLRVRGLRPNSASRLLVLQSLLIGVLASLLGILTGWATSMLFFPAAAATVPHKAFEATYVAKRGWLSVPSAETVLIALLAGVAVSVGPAYIWGRKASKIEPAEARSGNGKGVMTKTYDLAEGTRPGRGTDMLLVAISFASILSHLLLARAGELGIAPGLWAMVLQTVLVALYAIMPLAPFFLIIGTTRLITRPDPSISGLAKLLKPVSGPFSHLVERCLVGSGRQVWRASLVISLCLGFAGLVTISMSSLKRYNEALAPLITGGDLNVAGLEDEEVEIVSNYLRQQGAEIFQALEIRSFVADSLFYAIDPENYPVDGRIKPRLRAETEKALESLEATKMGALVSRRNSGEAKPGQTVRRRCYVGDKEMYITLTSAGGYRVMPGLREWLGSATIVSQDTYHLLEANITDLKGNAKLSTILIADFPPETDLAAIRDSVVSLLPKHLFNESDIRIIGEGVSRQRGPSIFVRTEFFYLLFLTMIGVNVVIVALLHEYEPLFRTVAARGLRARAIFSIGSAIGLCPIIMGVTSGILTGTLAGYYWALQSTDPNVPLMVVPVFGVDFVLFVALSVLGFLAVLFFTARWVAGRVQVSLTSGDIEGGSW